MAGLPNRVVIEESFPRPGDLAGVGYYSPEVASGNMLWQEADAREVDLEMDLHEATHTSLPTREPPLADVDTELLLEALEDRSLDLEDFELLRAPRAGSRVAAARPVENPVREKAGEAPIAFNGVLGTVSSRRATGGVSRIPVWVPRGRPLGNEGGVPPGPENVPADGSDGGSTGSARLRRRGAVVNGLWAELVGELATDGPLTVFGRLWKSPPDTATRWFSGLFGNRAKLRSVRRVRVGETTGNDIMRAINRGDDPDHKDFPRLQHDWRADVYIPSSGEVLRVSLRLLARLLPVMAFRERNTETLRMLSARATQHASGLKMSHESLSWTIHGTCMLAMMVSRAEASALRAANGITAERIVAHTETLSTGLLSQPSPMVRGYNFVATWLSRFARVYLLLVQAYLVLVLLSPLLVAVGTWALEELREFPGFISPRLEALVRWLVDLLAKHFYPPFVKPGPLNPELPDPVDWYSFIRELLVTLYHDLSSHLTSLGILGIWVVSRWHFVVALTLVGLGWTVRPTEKLHLKAA